MRTRYWPLKALKIAVLAAVAVAVVGFVVMSLWNWLVPALFGRPTIGFVEAIGLFILAKLLFGGFRGGGPGYYWRRRMHERWEQMSPEERERFRAGMRRGCGFEARAATADGSQQPPAAAP